jgi:hypothetical protein
MCENYPKPYVVGKAVLDADIKKNKKHSEACEKSRLWVPGFRVGYIWRSLP